MRPDEGQQRESILVVEDWPADQERFLNLLREAVPRDEIHFAWDGWDEQVLTVERMPEVIARLGVSCVLLDLAWNRADERLIVSLRDMDADGILENHSKLATSNRLSGLRFLDEVKPEFPGLYIVVVTQYQSRTLERACLRIGADAVYRKWDEIEAQVRNAHAEIANRRVAVQGVQELLRRRG